MILEDPKPYTPTRKEYDVQVHDGDGLIILSRPIKARNPQQAMTNVLADPALSGKTIARLTVDGDEISLTPQGIVSLNCDHWFLCTGIIRDKLSIVYSGRKSEFISAAIEEKLIRDVGHADARIDPFIMGDDQDLPAAVELVLLEHFAATHPDPFTKYEGWKAIKSIEWQIAQDGSETVRYADDLCEKQTQETLPKSLCRSIYDRYITSLVTWGNLAKEGPRKAAKYLFTRKQIDRLEIASPTNVWFRCDPWIKTTLLEMPWGDKSAFVATAVKEKPLTPKWKS